jgi:hypothetical protein
LAVAVLVDEGVVRLAGSSTHASPGDLMSDLTYALAEEIGDPDLFVGRKVEMARLLDWAAGVKKRISKSTGILSRRKKGKTALLQRFFNILYTRNDPQLVPFYYRIPEERLAKTDFAKTFYLRLLSQYFAFTTRTPELVAMLLPLDELKELAASDRHVAADIRGLEDVLENSPGTAWLYVREAGHRISQLNDVRIVQILDEFQYLNRWIVADHDLEVVEELCYSYMGAAESKFSPQIVAGSYIGWLGAILRHMTGRYREWRLEGLADEEALEAVYNYAYAYRVPITDGTAPYLAEVCDNDPFYIAATISNRIEEKDLTTPEGVREALALETVSGKGEIARVWNEYLWDAFARVNDTNARKIVLYLAAHEPEERGRDQILADLKLDMTDQQLEERLHKLVKADILAEGSSNYRYRGLGDRIFAMVFRRIYGEEIERVNSEAIEDEFKKDLASARGQIARHKGLAAEYKVRYRLLAASLRGATLADVVSRPLPGAEEECAVTLDRFTTIRKAQFHLDQEHSVEIDLHAVSERDDGTDLMVEVKDWQRDVTRDVVRHFIEVKEAFAGRLERKTAFLFYSDSGLSAALATMLGEAGILILDAEKLAGYETPPGL